MARLSEIMLTLYVLLLNFWNQTYWKKYFRTTHLFARFSFVSALVYTLHFYEQREPLLIIFILYTKGIFSV